MTVRVWRRRLRARWYVRLAFALVALAEAVDAATRTLRQVPWPSPHR